MDSLETLLASKRELSSDVERTGLDFGVALAPDAGAGAEAASFIVPLYGDGGAVGLLVEGRGVMPK